MTNTKHTPFFLTLEGIDGCGKTTQAKRLKTILEKHGFEVVLTREPGGTELAEKIRSIILGEDIDPLSELFLFQATRADHVKKIIQPALATGKIVICDRFHLSTIVYQGILGGLLEDIGRHQLFDILKIAARDTLPDRNYLLRIGVETAQARMHDRDDKNRFDTLSIEKKRRLIHAFDQAGKEFQSIAVIDGEQSEASVTNAILTDLSYAFMHLGYTLEMLVDLSEEG